MWWHGVPGSGTPIPCLFCVTGEFKDGVVGTLLAGLLRAPSTESSKVELRASCETSNINEPFANIQLTEQSASAMSNAMDQLGRARGDSLERMEGGDRQKEKNSRRATLFNGISRLTTRSAQRKLLGGGTVPLIDFSRLKIILSRLLGMGSTARVYEGRWCGRKVAVKVLFTVEITSAEIQRTCMEASLLHSLQSPNVVRLFGIAVLPPSLCVVLEICSEGSLGNVLYSMEDKRKARAASNILGRLSSSGRLSTTDQLNSIGRGSVTGRKSIQNITEYIYALPWGERLELAVGASRGVAALVAALPGTSHNDIKSANYLVDCPDQNTTDHGGSGGGGKASGGGGGGGPGVKFVVKLADVEFASVGDTPEHMTRGDTPNWTAPEVLNGTATVSPASDMYALANVLFEIAAREIPFENEVGPSDVSISVRQHIIEGRRPVFPEPQTAAEVTIPRARGDEATVSRAAIELTSRALFRALVEQAWSQDPAVRPEAAALVAALEALHNDYLEHMKALTDDRRRASTLMFRATAGSERRQGDRAQVESRLDEGVIRDTGTSLMEF
jgi:serine/threonine protein kinase